MRVVFEDYWQELREAMEQSGSSLPPADLEVLIGELQERGVTEVRLALRWLHVLNVEAAGGALPASDAFAHRPLLHFGTYALITARAPEGILFEFRQRHYPEQGQPLALYEDLRERLEKAGFRVLGGRWQAS
ncbi:MAG: hypothetical protein HY321_20700 [Armatimonadetes bacterium]|nr:hypothetical protein [Armatimonadota bacterium]